MERTVIQIARVRIADLRRGDVVNQHPDDDLGWFVVHEMRQLPSGELVANGTTAKQSLKGDAVDIVGLQIAKHIPMTASNSPASAAS